MLDCPMADLVAITAIIVSGVVGPAATSWLANRRLRQEHTNARVLADRAEMRTILAEATRDLTRVGRIRAALKAQFLEHGPQTILKEPRTVEAFKEAGREADLHRSALALRLGASHPAAVHYAEAVTAATDSLAAVRLAHGPGSTTTREAWKSLEKSAADFERSHDQFMAAAHELAKAELGAT